MEEKASRDQGIEASSEERWGFDAETQRAKRGRDGNIFLGEEKRG